MMTNAKKVQIVLLTLVFAQLCFPTFVWLSKTVTGNKADDTELHGATVAAQPPPKLTPGTWLRGDFADAAGKWFGQTFRGRPLMVRLNNQLDYSLFRKSTMEEGGLIVGKGDQLYEKVYLDDYCNVLPAIPEDRMNHIVGQMAELKARLAKRNIPFVVLITPGKAATYPEYIPDGYAAYRNGKPLNYDNLVPLLNQYGIDYIDGHQLMAKLRATDKMPLYVRGGIHWNEYGAYQEAQLLEDKLNARMGGGLAPMHLDGVRWDHIATGEDADIAKLLNLYHPPLDYDCPRLTVHTDGGAPTKSLVVCGGSFDWKLLTLFDQQKTFKHIRFFYYYHTLLANYPEQPMPVPFDASKIDWPHDVFSANAVVVEINESMMGSGVNMHYTAFVDDALKHIDADGTCH